MSKLNNQYWTTENKNQSLFNIGVNNLPIQ